jgi:hypothetical protein
MIYVVLSARRSSLNDVGVSRVLSIARLFDLMTSRSRERRHVIQGYRTIMTQAQAVVELDVSCVQYTAALAAYKSHFL